MSAAYRLTLAVGCALAVSMAAPEKGVTKAAGPPAFFLQSGDDGLCLAGSEFKRCAIDTLWFVTGKPGKYSLHRRPVEGGDDDQCLDRYALLHTSTKSAAAFSPAPKSLRKR